MPRAASNRLESHADAARHPISDMPYRALVFARLDHNNVPLFLVAGCDNTERGAEKALRLAYDTHGGRCFYCHAADELTIDHVEASARSGSSSVHNLVLACKPCNERKNMKPIEAFDPAAGREWLQALLLQVQDRLNRL